MTGWDSRTLGAHVASLRQKGPCDPDVLRATAEATTKPGERHARINVADLRKHRPRRRSAPTSPQGCSRIRGAASG